jgi:hypothetical protein
MSYRFEWAAAPALLGALLLPVLVPSFALIALVVVAVAAFAALVALAGAILATPYLVVRTVRRRIAERHGSTVARAATAANRYGLTALAEPATARRSQ